MLQMPPLSLYVHLPWCISKCPYCDFNSYAAPAQLPEARYVQALLADLELDAPLIQGRELRSIFLVVAPRACSNQTRLPGCCRRSVQPPMPLCQLR